MSTDTGAVQNDAAEEIVEQVVEQVQQDIDDQPEVASQEQVPLSALQKERRKRQDAELELKWHREQMAQKTPQVQEPDESIYEAATKEDLGKVKQQVIRDVHESTWINSNPEKAAEVNEKLSEFLKQRPHLARAIEAAPNRYEEAWTLMDALTSKQKAILKAPAKKDSPGNPASVPKAAALNQVLNFSAMSDQEFNAWRQAQRQRR